jgi:predicted phosphodiesterase
MLATEIDAMSATRIAAIADVHGNTWALDAVLADIEHRGVERIVNLGDSLYGSLDPSGSAERLMRPQITSISGNQDREVFVTSEAVVTSADHRFVTGQLNAAQLAWLRALPSTLVLGEIFCCHGTPTSDETYLLETVTPHGVRLSDTATIARRLQGVQQPVVLCAHSHVPRAVWLPGGQLIVNPGSVGIPAYDQDVPCPHVMEAGSPHARYALIELREHGWCVEHIAVAYPWHEAAAAARRRGREDRAGWIETGRAILRA